MKVWSLSSLHLDALQSEKDYKVSFKITDKILKIFRYLTKGKACLSYNGPYQNNNVTGIKLNYQQAN